MHYAVDAAATPILFVHGIIDTHSIFTSMERALRRRGFSDLSWFDYGLLTSDVRRAAADFATAVERLTADSGYERIHIIGHSLGGLIARYYVQCMGGYERVRTLITLGTPHAGTELARAASMLHWSPARPAPAVPEIGQAGGRIAPPLPAFIEIWISDRADRNGRIET